MLDLTKDISDANATAIKQCFDDVDSNLWRQAYRMTVHIASMGFVEVKLDPSRPLSRYLKIALSDWGITVL